jgi:pSer/pThr/pTyr-binding forkhead associated (FHA) protein
MASIILSVGTQVLREIPLAKEHITIGRRPHNDIVIDDLAISGEHAVIVTLNGDSFLEDLNSTNGTKVNGQPVKKHFLQNDDVIQLAQFSIRYSERADAESSLTHVSGQGATKSSGAVPVIRVVSGPNAGKEINVFKSITTIGIPGGQVAGVFLDGSNYIIQHLEGSCFPYVNNLSIGAEPSRLIHGDIIEIGDVRMVFLLP